MLVGDTVRVEVVAAGLAVVLALPLVLLLLVLPLVSTGLL